MVGQPFEQHHHAGSIPRRAVRTPATDVAIPPAEWLRRGMIAVVLAACVGFAATLGAAFAFDDHPSGCAAPDGSASCCRLLAQDEFAARRCEEAR
ncbi:MAG: hypothetical protein HY873_09355 [Chloroflexi bacterium]|nr:hypothetical protein [Chloroflexota bacterium]